MYQVYITFSHTYVIDLHGIQTMLKLSTQKVNLPKVFCLELMAFYACNNGLLPIYFFAIHLLAKKTRTVS